MLRRLALLTGVLAACRGEPPPVATDPCGPDLESTAASQLACPSESPPRVPDDAPRFVSLGVSWSRTCGITTDHDVLCWGQHRRPLEPAAPIVPVHVELPAGFQPVKLRLSFDTGCVLGVDRSVACWGSVLGAGRLPDKRVYTITDAERVPDVHDAVALAVAKQSGCVVTEDGGVTCWGGGYGVGALPQRQEVGPMRIRKLKPATDVALSEQIGCAMLRSGSVQCWNGNHDPIDLPVNDAVSLSVEFDAACVAQRSGSVSCWAHLFDAMWHGSTDAPVDGLEDTAIVSGAQEGCAVDRSGNVDCWTSRHRAERVEGLKAKEVAFANGAHSCALDADDHAWCWGANDAGELGAHTPVVFLEAQDVCGLDPATQVVTGSAHTCALLRSGAVSCFGAAYHGQLGADEGVSNAVPVSVAGVHDAIALAAGDNHTCALARDGTVMCWGGNEVGESTGTGVSSRPVAPTPVALPAHAVELVASDRFTCARLVDGRVACWGAIRITAGQIGDSLVVVPGIDDAQAIARSNESYGGVPGTCALRPNGRVTCWGVYSSHDVCKVDERCGPEPRDIGQVPRLRSPVGRPFAGAAAKSCTIDAAGVTCRFPAGQFARTEGVRPFGDATDIIQVDGNEEHVCAVRRSGRVSCWGENAYGQIGTGATGWTSHPVPVAFDPQ